MHVPNVIVKISEAGSAARPDLKPLFTAWALKAQEQAFKALSSEQNSAVGAALNEPAIVALLEKAIKRWATLGLGGKGSFRQFIVDDLQKAIEATWDSVGFFEKGKLMMKAAYLKTPAAILMRVHTDVVNEVST